MADLRNRNNVLVGAPDVQASGGILIGEAQTTTSNYPTDAHTELSAELKLEPAGFVSEDGVTKTVDRSTEKIKDWNGDTVIVLETEHSVIAKWTFLESANATVLKAVYGADNVKVDKSKKSVVVSDAAGELPHQSYAFELNPGGGKKGRLFIPDGQVTSVGDVTFVKGDVIKYEVEVECFADADSKKFYQYLEMAGAGEDPAA